MKTYTYYEYTLTLEDTGVRDGHGKSIVKYNLSDKEGTIFEGRDLHASSLHGPESLDTAGALLTFLTLRVGDVEPDWFKDYTERQLDFRDSEAEDLSLWAYDISEGLDFEEGR